VPIDTSTAFVSYSREDLDFVIRLAKDVKEKGARLWVDKVDIRAGQRWEAEIEAAVSACSRMLVVLSPAAISSRNVLAEASLAIDDGKEVIPILYRDCKVPFRLRPLQYADFRTDYATGLTELLAVLTGGIELTPPVTSDQTRLESERQQAAEEQARIEREENERKIAEEKAHKEKLERQSLNGEQAHVEQERQRIAAEQSHLDEERKQAAAEKVRLEELERKAAEEKSKQAKRKAQEAVEEPDPETDHNRKVNESHEELLLPRTQTEKDQVDAGEKTADSKRRRSREIWISTVSAIIVGVFAAIFLFHEIIQRKVSQEPRLQPPTVQSSLESPKELLTLKGHKDDVESLAWSPDGKWLATASDDGTTKIWDAETGKDLQTVMVTVSHSVQVMSVAWSPDGRRFATGSSDKMVKIWDRESGTNLLTLKGHRDVVDSVAWSPDGKRLATGSFDKTARIWDAESGKELLTMKGFRGSVNSIAWSPDGTRFATGIDNDLYPKIWDAETGKLLLVLKGQTWNVCGVAWSPDGRMLAAGSCAGYAEVWSLEAGTESPAFRLGKNVQDSGADCVAWSPDGKRLATGFNEIAKVWDAKTGNKLFVLTPHAEGKSILAGRVAWSPDGLRLATVNYQSVIVWGIGRQE